MNKFKVNALYLRNGERIEIPYKDSKTGYEVHLRNGEAVKVPYTESNENFLAYFCNEMNQKKFIFFNDIGVIVNTNDIIKFACEDIKKDNLKVLNLDLLNKDTVPFERGTGGNMSGVIDGENSSVWSSASEEYEREWLKGRGKKEI